MNKTRILCVLSTVLGNKAASQKILQVLSKVPDLEPIPVLLGSQNYRDHPAPWWARLTNPWESQYVSWQTAQPFLAKPYDMLLVNSWENVTGFREVARRVPAAAVMDNNPGTVNSQLRERGKGGWQRTVSNALHAAPFRRAVAEFDYLLPMGSDCLDSLVEDFGCDRTRCHVMLVPQDLDLWHPAPSKTSSGPLRLLFVGNDFDRKGGEFLLNLYSNHLADNCRLTIVCNDPAVSTRRFPEGVTVLRSLSFEQLLDTYHQSDVFVFPTHQDFMPQVLAEALATGVPCISNDVGGIRDLVRTGETGFLMSRADPAELWAQRIRELDGNRVELARLSAGARKFAEENLGLPQFEKLIADIISRMRLIRKR